MQKPNRGPGSLDWHKIKAEFLTTQISLNKLREKHGVATAYFFKKTKGWHAEKAELQKKAITNLKADVVDFYESYVSRSKQLMERMMDQFDKLIAEGLIKDPDGKVWPLRPESLLDIAKAFSENLKAVRLMEGKSTDNKAVGVGVSGDLHGVLMKLMHAIENNEETDDA